MYTCGVEKKCGACQLSNMDYERQLRFKQAAVVKLLRRFGHVEDIIGMDEPYFCNQQVGGSSPSTSSLLCPFCGRVHISCLKQR